MACAASSLRYRARGFDIARIAPREALVDGMQLVRYQPGQLFRAHHDYFGKAKPLRQAPPGPEEPYPWPQVVDRYVTFFGYLNTLEGDSGHTVFTKVANPPEGYKASQTSNRELFVCLLSLASGRFGPMVCACKCMRCYFFRYRPS